MPTHKLTPGIINAAIEGFESQKQRLDIQIAELRQSLTGTPRETAAPEARKGKRRKMSAAARKRIGDAQRKRWAASKGTSLATVSSEAPKRKRKLSAAGKRAIVEATKKRWAAFHAAKKAEAPTVSRKGAAKKNAAKKPTARKAPVKASRKAA